MALMPRWRYMTEGSKSIAKKTAINVVIIFIGLTLYEPYSPGSCLV